MIEAFVIQGVGQAAAEPTIGVNVDAVDSWTLVHLGTGLISGLIGLPFWAAISVATAYEVVEYMHEWPKGSILFGSKQPESPANVAVDMLAFSAGWGIGARVR